MLLRLFQSTFPRRERHERRCGVQSGSESFNPRSREGNDLLTTSAATTRPVSIHVPAKGTTLYNLSFDTAFSVSIHVPAKGTTAIIHKFLYVPYYYLYNYTNIILIEQVHLPYTSYSPLIFSQYCGANLPDTLCSLLFRTRPALHCCFI